MKHILLSAVLLFVAASNLRATEALIFNGDGHDLYILVGYSDRPVIAEVRYTPPGATEWISVPREQLQIQKFDMGKQVLLMRFSNKEKKADLPPSFSFSVKKKKAVLSINGKQIKSSFDWLDDVGT